MPDALFDVTALRVVVTGGARGIGLGAARALLERGAETELWDTRADALDEAVSDTLAPWAGGIPDRRRLECRTG